MTHVVRLNCAACAQDKRNTRVGWVDRDDDGRLVLSVEVHLATPPDQPAAQPDPDWFVTASEEDIAAHLAGIPDGKARPRRETRRYVDDLDPHGAPLAWDCWEPGCEQEKRLTAERCREMVAAGKREVDL